jgi:hypothetical protein
LNHAPPHIQLQACLADSNGVSEHRCLVSGKGIKYITVESGVIPPEGISFQPVLRIFLPIFPPGDQNEGHVVKDLSSGMPSSLQPSGVIFPALRTYGTILESIISNLLGSAAYGKISALSIALSLKSP